MTRRLRIEEGWFTLLLVWALVIIGTLALLDAELIDGLETVPFVATAAVFVGLALAKSRLAGRTAHLFALIYGLFLVTYLIGSTLPEPLTWRDRVVDLVQRQVVWISKALSKGSSRDGLIFVLHTSGVYWLLGYAAAWYTFRDLRIWRVVLPSGLVLLSVIYYYYGPRPLVIFLALYALVALIYIARTYLVSQERAWRSAAVRYDSEIRFSFLQASFVVALVALGVAWALPTAQASAAVNDALGDAGVMGTWRSFQDNWTRLFASLRSYGSGTSDLYRDTLALGGPRNVGNTLIMDIYAQQQIPYVYWQAVAYDTYQGGAWSISESDQLLHLPDEGKLDLAFAGLRNEVVQTVINYVPNAGTIYGAPEIMNVDRQIFVTQSLDGAGKLVVHQVQSRFVLRQGDRYQVLSRISLADKTSLRLASQEYPEWIKDRYLQVPDTITPETIALAEALTAAYDNPFDKAIAVRDYLRNNIGYNDQISAPPDGVEPVHYILFDRREAYCNYYASAMIMMLRSQGVPARFVAGYAQGEWDEESSSYRVRASNAHAWVEVFFPGYGWIQFEPTASLPPGDRPETTGNPGDAFASSALPGDNERGFDEGLLGPEADFESQGALLGEEGGLLTEQTAGGVRPWQVVAAVVLLVLAATVAFVGSRINRRVESSVERSYARLASWARWLGVVIRPVHTPYERANLLAGVVPEGKEPLRNLAYQYVRQRFSPAKAAEAGFSPLEEWRVLRPVLLRRSIGYQIERWRERNHRA